MTKTLAISETPRYTTYPCRARNFVSKGNTMEAVLYINTKTSDLFVSPVKNRTEKTISTTNGIVFNLLSGKCPDNPDLILQRNTPINLLLK